MADNPTIPSKRDIAARHPTLGAALLADAKTTCAFRGERFKFRSTLDGWFQVVRLAVVSDAFIAQACYRIKAALQRAGVPLVPYIFHRLAIGLGQVCIGDPVVIGEGLYLLHGQVVIDGVVTIGENVRIAPFVTVGLKRGSFVGPTIGSNVIIGTGARVLGPITIGNGAHIGANAVVITDVPPKAVAVGVPAKITTDR
jgi:serine O-acetyltransferase